MSGILLQVTAFIWVVGNGNVPLGMMFASSGLLLSYREKNSRLQIITWVLCVVVVIAGSLRLLTPATPR